MGEVAPPSAVPNNKAIFSELLHAGKLQYMENATHVFDCQRGSSRSIRESLEEWMARLRDPYLFWYHYDPNVEPLGKNGRLDITFDHLVGRSDFEAKPIVIQTISGKVKLFNGQMLNGRIRGQVSREMLTHPGWKGRLVIGLSTPISGISFNDLPDANFEHFVTCTLKNGELDGLVQIFGIMANDPKGHCSSTITPG